MKKQAGVASVELAIVAVAFMLILMGAIEVSRMLFTWNTLDAVTQRAARVAAVCPPNHPLVFQAASFGDGGGAGTILPGFTTANLQIEYLDTNGLVTANIANMRYVRASVINYQHQLAIPFIANAIASSPQFTTTIPSESLGFIPFDGVRNC